MTELSRDNVSVYEKAYLSLPSDTTGAVAFDGADISAGLKTLKDILLKKI